MRFYIFKINLFMLLFYITACRMALYSQEADVLDRTIPPKISNPKIPILPKPVEKKLRNGLPVFIIEKHDQPLVSIRLYIKGGSYFDMSLPGLASLTSEMINKGTKKRNAKQISEQIEFLGASLSSDAGWDGCYVNLDLLKKYFDESLEIFSDCILNSNFPSNEIDRCIERRIDQIKQWKTEPGYLAGRTFSDELFKGHPYSAPSYGDEKSLKLIKQKDILKYYNTYFNSENSFFVIVGDISTAEVLEKFEKTFGKWKKGLSPQYKNYKFNYPDSTRIFIIDRPNSVQSSINMGFICMDKNNPEIPKMNLINTYLGGYFRCQLIANLREKNGYTYGASSWFDSRKFPGPFAITTEIRTEVTANAIDEILIEIDSLKERLISDSRLNEVKNYIIGSFPMNLQSNSQIAGLISNIKLYDLPDDYYNRLFTEVSKSTAEEILNLSKKLFEKRNFIIAITGDAEKIKDSLTKFGSVKIIREDEHQSKLPKKED
jgi:zinc protease